MGKAISKCLKSLPCCPTKKKAVMPGVANKFGLTKNEWYSLRKIRN